MKRTAALALVAAVAFPAAAQQPITVGPAVRVSAALRDEPHFETLIGAHPTDPARLIACSMLFSRGRQSHETVTYVSDDRGRTWRNTLRVAGAREAESWDPACVYGPDGVAWSVSEGLDSAGAPYVRLDRSPDGGTHWAAPRLIKHFERSYITIDHTTGARRGRIFLHGTASMRNTDTATFTGGIGVNVLDSAAAVVRTDVIPAGDGNHPMAAGPGVVLSDGSLVGAFTEFLGYQRADGPAVPRYRLTQDGPAWPNAAVKVVHWSDSGLTVSPVADLFLTWPPWASSVSASLAADVGSGRFQGRLYIVWNDERSGRSEILLAYSSDGGRTWSAPRTVNDDRPRRTGPGPDDFLPDVAVNASGVVGIVWNDRRDQPDNLAYDVRFTASLDGGDTFLPSVRVSPEPHVPARGERWVVQATARLLRGGGARRLIGMHSFNFSGGHTRGIAADAGGAFHTLWMANTGGVPQIWTARIAVAGTVAPHSGGPLAALADVSGQAELALTGLRLTRQSGAIDGWLSVVNRGHEPIRAPLVVRVLDLRSALGVPTIANADNGRPGAGATFDLSALIDGGGLAPGAATRPKAIRFTLALLDSLAVDARALSGVIVLRSAVLAGGLR